MSLVQLKDICDAKWLPWPCWASSLHVSRPNVVQRMLVLRGILLKVEPMTFFDPGKAQIHNRAFAIKHAHT